MDSAHIIKGSSWSFLQHDKPVCIFPPSTGDFCGRADPKSTAPLFSCSKNCPRWEGTMKSWESSRSSLASPLHEQISSQVGLQLWLANVRRAGVGAGSVIEVFREARCQCSSGRAVSRAEQSCSCAVTQEAGKTRSNLL